MPNHKKTNEYVDDQLIGRFIKRLGNYEGHIKKIPFQCEICNKIWNATPHNILICKTGCPACASTKLNNEKLDLFLIDKPLKRLGECTDSKTKISFVCLQCNFIWEANANNIKSKHWCPVCSGWKISNEKVDKKIKGRPLIRIGNVISGKIPIPFKCLKCSHVWDAAPNNIMNNGRGCPICNMPGQNEKMLYLELQKYGEFFEHNYDISNIDATSQNKYRLDFYYPQFNFVIELNGKQHYEPSTWNSNTGKEAAQERLIKQQKRDQYIDNFCKERNIYILWIDGRVYFGATLRQYIKDNIIPLIQKNKDTQIK